MRLRSLYATVTKWGIVLAGPLLAVLVVAPGPLLELLFGSRYGGSEPVVIARILSVGYAVTVLMGLNAVNLVAFGTTKAIGVRSAAAFFANILLNVVLIARFGAVGAAIGTSTVYVGLNLANSALIWKLGRLHPIRRDVATVAAAAVALTMLSFVLASLFQWSGSLKSSLLTALVVGAGSLAAWVATSSPRGASFGPPGFLAQTLISSLDSSTRSRLDAKAGLGLWRLSSKTAALSRDVAGHRGSSSLARVSPMRVAVRNKLLPSTTADPSFLRWGSGWISRCF